MENVIGVDRLSGNHVSFPCFPVIVWDVAVSEGWQKQLQKSSAQHQSVILFREVSMMWRKLENGLLRKALMETFPSMLEN